MYIVIVWLSIGETNLDSLMTTLITAVEEHNVQLEREIQEEVRRGERKEVGVKRYREERKREG